MIDPEDDTVYSVDTRGYNDKLWLVKIPSYLYTEWNNAPEDSTVAKIRTERISEKVLEYQLICNPKFTKPEDIPDVYKFEVQEVVGARKGASQSGSRNSLSYILKSSNIESKKNPSKKPKYTKKSIIGIAAARCRIMPPDNDLYFAMKAKKIQALNASLTTQRKCDIRGNDLESSKSNQANQGYRNKPKFLGSSNKRKEVPERVVRIDRKELTNLICSYFETHQYYKMADITTLTGQPVTYVKEVLSEIAQLSKEPGRRNMWELKPEYSHYS